MKSAQDPNAFWESALERYSDRVAVVSADGQSITFARLNRAISNIADILIDYGAGPGSRISCSIPNFAVTVAYWFATWRIGGHVMTSLDPRQFIPFGLTPDFVISPAGEQALVGNTVPIHSKLLVDEFGEQTTKCPGKTYFHTANTPRATRAMAVRPEQLVKDAQHYADLLGAPAGGVYMTTGLSSLRAMRDVFRTMQAGVHIIGGDVAVDAAWPLIRQTETRELMLSPLSLHLILKHAGDADKSHEISRVFVGAGTARPDLLARAYDFFGDVIDLGAGTNETSVYALKKFNPADYHPGEIGKTCCGIVGEIRDAQGAQAQAGEVGQLALWVPKEQRFEGYINGPDAYDPNGWVYPGFLATLSKDGEFTKLGRTDDRINLGGTRLFSGKVEAQLERLNSVKRSAVIRVYDSDGAEALGIVVEPGTGFDASALQSSLARSLRGIGAILVRSIVKIPLDDKGQPDRKEVERIWLTLNV